MQNLRTEKRAKTSEGNLNSWFEWIEETEQIMKDEEICEAVKEESHKRKYVYKYVICISFMKCSVVFFRLLPYNPVNPNISVIRRPLIFISARLVKLYCCIKILVQTLAVIK